jgi:hypothetical protein
MEYLIGFTFLSGLIFLFRCYYFIYKSEEEFIPSYKVKYEITASKAKNIAQVMGVIFVILVLIKIITT